MSIHTLLELAWELDGKIAEYIDDGNCAGEEIIYLENAKKGLQEEVIDNLMTAE